MAPSRGSKGTMLPALSQLLGVAGNPLLVTTSLQSLPLSSHGALPACVPPPLLISSPVRLHLGSTLTQCDLILTNYIYQDPISKKAHILRFWAGMNVKGTLFNPVHLCWQFGGKPSPGQMESHPSLSTAPFIPRSFRAGLRTAGFLQCSPYCRAAQGASFPSPGVHWILFYFFVKCH